MKISEYCLELIIKELDLQTADNNDNSILLTAVKITNDNPTSAMIMFNDWIETGTAPSQIFTSIWNAASADEKQRIVNHAAMQRSVTALQNITFWMDVDDVIRPGDRVLINNCNDELVYAYINDKTEPDLNKRKLIHQRPLILNWED